MRKVLKVTKVNKMWFYLCIARGNASCEMLIAFTPRGAASIFSS